MADAKYTKGPWEVRQLQLGAKGPFLISANIDGIGEKNGGMYVAHAIGPEREANARIIAAAPALVEALQDILAHRDRVPAHQCAGSDCSVCTEGWGAAYTALSLALPTQENSK